MLDFTVQLIGNGTLLGDEVLSSAADALEFGRGGFTRPQLVISQASQGVWYHTQQEIAATSDLQIDLLDLANVFGDVDFHYVSLVLLQVIEPESGKEVIFGPQSESDAFIGWSQDASDAEAVTDTLLRFDANESWQVQSDEKILTITNDTAEAITVRLLVVGGYYTAPDPPVVSGTVTPGSGTLDITWTAPTADPLAPVKQYALYIDDGGGYALDDTVDASVTSHQFTGLSASLHSIKVRSVNQAGESVDSNVVTGTPS